MRPGSIVSLRRFGDPLAFWVVAQRIIGERGRYRVVRENRDGRRFSHDVGAGDVILIAEPEFVIGQQLKHNARVVEVVAIGGETIRVSFRAPREIADGQWIDFGERQSEVSRADLVLGNIKALLAQVGEP